MAVKCSDCEYSHFQGSDEYGFCRRYPPSVRESLAEAEEGIIKGIVFRRHIRVHKDDKCGEFLAS